MPGITAGALRAARPLDAAIRPWALRLATALITAAAPASAGAQGCADLALVLAVDTSGSVNAREFDLQVGGLAAAFLRPDVQAAFASAGTVAAAAVFWGDARRPAVTLPWVRIEGPGDAAAFAAALAAGAARIGGDTGLGEGLDAALDLLDAPEACAARRVVNVSGDGKPSYGRFGHSGAILMAAQARAHAAGATVNGLAIQDVEPDLAAYYRTHVATGAGSFVMEVARHEDFADAIARKITREVAPAMLARAD